MIPPLNAIIENTYIRDSYRQPSGYTYAHTQTNKHIVCVNENHVFYGLYQQYPTLSTYHTPFLKILITLVCIPLHILTQ